jgi:hypothetical protein
MLSALKSIGVFPMHQSDIIEPEMDFDFTIHDSLLDMITGNGISIMDISLEISNQIAKLQEKSDIWKEQLIDHRDKFIKEKQSMLRSRISTQKLHRFRDKITFVLGVSYLWLTALILGKFPKWFSLYNFITVISLVTVRWFYYRSKKWHYFLADLCYFVNAAIIALTFFFPNSRHLFAAVFCLVNGPVGFAIIMWRNSLVFHSLDKMTSIAIHISPALTMYTLRWLSLSQESHPYVIELPDFAFNPNDPTRSLDFSFDEMICSGMIFYFIWQLVYVYFILIRRSKNVFGGSHATSFTYMLNDYRKNKPDSFLLALFYKVPEWSHASLFMLLNFIIAFSTMLPTILFYRYFWVHTIYILFLVMFAIFNGADYYIEVFSRRYTMELAKLDAAAKEMQGKKIQ